MVIQSMYTLNKKSIVLVILAVFTVLILLSMLVFAVGKKEVSIETSPAQAKYKIRSYAGETPGKIKLTPGKYNIEIKKAGYNNVKEEIKVPYFKNKITLKYDLKKTEFKETKLPTKEEAKAMQNKYDTDFPYANSLPAKSSTYYISRPGSDGSMNIYIFKAKEDEGKRDAEKWLKDHGADTNKLKINWIDSKNN